MLTFDEFWDELLENNVILEILNLTRYITNGVYMDSPGEQLILKLYEKYKLGEITIENIRRNR